jgi:hypothetical protein
MRTVRAVAVAAAGILAVACGQSDPEPVVPGTGTPEANAPGDIPDNQAFVPFTAPDRSFQVSVPEGWAQRADGPATVFTDKFNSVRIESTPAAAAPSVASATATEVPRLTSAVSGYRPGSTTMTQRKAGPVLMITYGARSAPDPVAGKTVDQAVERYEFWRGGTEVVLTLSAPKGSDSVDPWRTITDSFAWQP